MKIVFESSPERFNFPFRIIGSAGRYDTVSDCEFIDANHIICADRQMARLYLFYFDISSNTYTLLDSVECIVNGQPQNFELISYRDDVLYSISYKNTLFSCRIENNKFSEFQTIIIRPDDKYHGVLAPAGSDSVFVTNMTRPTVSEYNTKSKHTNTIVCSSGVRMKDIAILDSEHLLVLSSDSGPITGVRLSNGNVLPINGPYNSHLLVIKRKSGELVSKYTLENIQIDGCTYDEGRSTCYVTCTATDGSGFIFCSQFNTAYEFINMKKVPCAGFPHGVAVHGDLIAYTSYSESALYIMTLKEFHAS
jgi:hypothetical protein